MGLFSGNRSSSRNVELSNEAIKTKVNSVITKLLDMDRFIKIIRAVKV
jgi:hypothetical protein